MLHWKFVLEVGLPAAVAFIAILVILYNFFCCRAAPRHEHLQGADVNECRSRPDHADANIVHERQRSQGKLSNGLPKFRKDSFEVALKNSSKVASVCRSTHPFDWSEHPDLVAEAVEHGWSAFAFTYTCSIYPSCSNFWDKFRSSSHKHEYEPDLSWEVGASSEYMQKLWLNPGLILKKENCGSSVQALQASLPLPGPPLGSLSFPQEGYYEITIVADGNADAPRSSYVETEQGKLMSRHLLSGKHMGSEIFSEAKLDPSGDMQLMKDGSKSSKLSETLHNLSSHIEISKFVARDNPLAENLQILAIGLAAGGASPFRFPGLDIGSVGFHSDGRVYVNGLPHVNKDLRAPSVTGAWGVVQTTVGCGFEPSSRHVFFTVDGERVFDLVAAADDFGHPLYPTVAANYDVALLVNYGQNPFEYTRANSQRVPDPCFRRAHSRSVRSRYVNEDSGDLFSMGRIDSQWFMGAQSPSSDDVQHRHVFSEADSDFFEIVLDPRAN